MLEIDEKYLANEISKKTFKEWARICNEDGTKHIDLIDDYYIIKENKKPSERYLLEQEKRELENWLSAHDYIGIKIATNRATIDEYKDVIAEMNIKANRINEINELLKN